MKRPKLIVMLIVFTLCVGYSSSAHVQTLKATQPNKSWNQSEQRIWYDMSALFHTLKNNNQTGIQSDFWPNELSNFYLGGFPDEIAIIVNGKTSIGELHNLSAYLGPFGKENITNLLATKSVLLESIIISLVCDSNGCDCNPQNFSQIIQSTMNLTANKNVKMGLEINKKFLENCHEQQEFKFADQMNDTVLRVDLPGSAPMLSYGLFLDSITGHFESFKNFIRRFNSHSTLYIRPVGAGTENGTAEITAAHYDALGVQYLKAWTDNRNEYTDREIYIHRPSLLSNFSFTGNNLFLKEKLTAAIFVGNQSIFSDDHCQQQRYFECWEILKVVRSLFDNILLINPSQPFIVDYQRFISENPPPQSNKASSGLTSMLFQSDVVSRDQLGKIIGNLASPNIIANMHAVYIDCDYQGISTKKLGLDRMHAKNITIGCYMSVHENYLLVTYNPFLVDKLRKSCGELLEQSTEILVHVSVHINTDNDLLQLLLNLHKTKQTFREKYPGKTIVPMIRIAGLDKFQSAVHFKDKKLFNVSYCNTKIKRLNEYYQAILTFARIYQWNQLVLMSATNSKYDFVMYTNVETDGEIDRSSTNFPLLFRSNPEKSINGEHFPLTYPCINWTENADRNGIRFLERKYAGATFSAKLRKSPPMTPEELQTAVHFALSRFPFIEITGVDEVELSHENSIIKQLGFNVMQTLDGIAYSSMPLIYFQVSFRDAVNLWQDIGNLMARNYSAVHLSGWEMLSQKELSSVVMYLTKEQSHFSPKFGITVQNCSPEMNTGLINMKNLPFINKVGYVICNVKPISPNNINKALMQVYLDTIFYTKSYMEKFLSSSESNRVEVLFRINLMSRCPDAADVNRENFLRFINDVSQHASAFKIKYFIVSAYERKDWAAQCPNSWWRITDYNDLTNRYVYTDRENEYIGLNTHPEKKIPSPGSNSTGSIPGPTDYRIYLFSMLPLGALLVVVLIAGFLLWLQRQHYENRFLTQKEVNEFYKPGQTSDDEIPLNDVDSLNSANIEFPVKYEINERDIEVQEEIGRGQFGVVHVGILKKQDHVAIKIPMEGCSKEEFMSALSELKILCYVGRHQNIVSFLGAHTKNIRRGKLMIVIEYCGKGALDSYLRALDTGDNSPDLNLLYKFAHQIAAGMEHLAEKRIIHGDLATRNVLLTNELTCKISDFGLSRRLYDMSVYVKRGNEALPWMWMALESLKDMQFTTKSDVWSYAVTLWEIFSLGQLPYPGRRLTQGFIMELDSGIRMEKAPFASDAIHEKMLECWSLDQNERPSFTELKQYFAALTNHLYQNTTLL